METLQIAMLVTGIMTVIFLIFGGILFALSVHAESGQITVGLSIGTFMLKFFILEVIIMLVLFLMKLPMGIINIINGTLDEWNDVKRQYNRTFNKDKE